MSIAQSKTPYTRFFWSDWNADTGYLDLMQTGAYMKLLGYIYQHQRPLPGDLDKIYRICHAGSPTEQGAIREILSDYFVPFEDPEYGLQYRHSRAEREIEWSQTSHKKRVESGRLGGQAKSSNASSNATAMPEQCQSNAPSNQNQNQTTTNVVERPPKGKPLVTRKNFVKPTIEEVAAYCAERRNSIDPETFWNFYEARDWQTKNSKIRNWKSCVVTWERRDSSGDDEKPQDNPRWHISRAKTPESLSKAMRKLGLGDGPAGADMEQAKAWALRQIKLREDA